MATRFLTELKAILVQVEQTEVRKVADFLGIIKLSLLEANANCQFAKLAVSDNFKS
jgi:hypothetical protein